MNNKHFRRGRLFTKDCLSRLVFLLAVCLMLVSPPASTADENARPGAGTEENPDSISETTQNIVVDGRLDDAAWENALIVELDYETSPGENTPSPVKTEVYLIHNK
ncbi:MAG TPA: hypothetical protein VMX35_01060, partial [Acidobacteriota bacterium]|nr:hypothetical protein [Acidobacteriota bacterium]